MEPIILVPASEEITNLRRRFLNLPEVTSFDFDVDLASQIASYGLYREIGTTNDELARFIYDANVSAPIRLNSIKKTLVKWHGLYGVKISSTDSTRLELRTRGFYDVVHPGLSYNSDGTLHSLYIFPKIINKISKQQGIELVIVKSWGKNSIFGGFDPAKGYYQTNFWEIENNDVLKFSNLTRKGQVAFLGTHDLIAHIAGIDGGHWPLLKQIASRVFESISSYFGSVKTPSVSSLILPYTIGVVLDDLAQPPSYGSRNHIAVLEKLLHRLYTNEIPANLRSVLTHFPDSFQTIINLSRQPGIENSPDTITTSINSLTKEILNASIVSA